MSELKVDKVSPRSGTYVSLNTVGSKNIIINGDMSIAQRGTSVSGITADSYYTVDRFLVDCDSQGTWTMSQDTDVPSGQGFAKSLKMDCTTADAAPAASDKIAIQHRIEGQNLQYLKKGTSNSESLTASFWVKSNKTGTYICELFDVDNLRQISKAYTIDASNTWEKKTITFAGDTTGAFDNDNGLSFALDFFLGAGSNYTSGTLNTSWGSQVDANRAVGQVNLADSTANNFWITGVQLEAGTTASDFEFLPYDMNLQRCARYYQIVQEADGTGRIICNGAMYDNTGFYGTLYLGQRMRTNPTVSADTGTNAYQFLGNNADGYASSPTLVNISNNASIPKARFQGTVSVSLGQGNAAWVRFSASSSNEKITAEAEL